MAEICRACLPHMVDLHNYPAVTAREKKIYNWQTLNTKVFSKIGFSLENDQITNVASSKPGVIEEIILAFNVQMDMFYSSKHQQPPIQTLTLPDVDDSVEEEPVKEESIPQPKSKSKSTGPTQHPIQKQLSPPQTRKSIDKNPTSKPSNKKETADLEKYVKELEKENQDLKNSLKILQEDYDKLKASIPSTTPAEVRKPLPKRRLLTKK
ncbi:hypothetical protein BLNAU_15954 [Blattamonas nauphoetae]|uniref:CH-like domain-containing protein n=1 Tax=Blattamonas nauphoetae TaxID=2049346 RepID=A0ABQ9XCX3_9EUKA|nr:hypothetical protein BLNAU_15954 [Blattamonas nauphoetae]